MSEAFSIGLYTKLITLHHNNNKTIYIRTKVLLNHNHIEHNIMKSDWESV